MSERTRSGVVAALEADNVDTDLIIPMGALLTARRSDLGRHAFESIRYAADGTPDPGFALNDPRFAGASILLAGRNFGCGSSREGAVHALAGMGFDVVVASSFGDIFLANCVKNSVVPAQLDETELRGLHRSVAGSTGPVDGSLDLDSMQLTIGATTVPVHLDASLLDRLAGDDEIARTRTFDDRIDAFRRADRRARPWIWRGPASASGPHDQQGDT